MMATTKAGILQFIENQTRKAANDEEKSEKVKQ